MMSIMATAGIAAEQEELRSHQTVPDIRTARPSPKYEYNHPSC